MIKRIRRERGTSSAAENRRMTDSRMKRDAWEYKPSPHKLSLPEKHNIQLLLLILRLNYCNKTVLTSISHAPND